MADDFPARNNGTTVKENGETSPRGPGKRRASSQKPAGYLPDTHRSLPSSLDAEKGLLGSILLAPTVVLDECIQAGVNSEYFHHPAHGLVFDTAVAMRDANRPVDLISITQYLEDRKQLEEAGGGGAIADLFTFVPTAANASYYMQILREKFLLRRIITTCNEYSARAYDEQDNSESLLDEAESKILAIAGSQFATQIPDMAKISLEVLDRIEKTLTNRGQISGLATGFSGLDKMTDGLHPGEMAVIAARPSMGKTAFAMNIAEHAVMQAGKSVAVYSLEMSTLQLVQRLLCSRARVNLNKVRAESAGSAEMRNLIAATQELSKTRMYIDDTPGLSILDLRARCRRLHSRYKLDLVVIDYLQLLRSNTRKAQDNRQVEVAEISAGIKALAKELSVPVLVLAQLNRNPESRTGGSKGKPRLSDLRESGSIEQDADLVGLLWREDYYADDEDERKETEGKAELLIAKQRNGPTGEVPLTFLHEYTRFEDRAFGREEPGR